jgi:hypothetical protein
MKDLTKLAKRGNSRTPTKDEILEMKALKAQGYTLSSIAKAFCKARGTVGKYVNA